MDFCRQKKAMRDLAEKLAERLHKDRDECVHRLGQSEAWTPAEAELEDGRRPQEIPVWEYDDGEVVCRVLGAVESILLVDDGPLTILIERAGEDTIGGLLLANKRKCLIAPETTSELPEGDQLLHERYWLLLAAAARHRKGADCLPVAGSAAWPWMERLEAAVPCPRHGKKKTLSAKAVGTDQIAFDRVVVALEERLRADRKGWEHVRKKKLKECSPSANTAVRQLYAVLAPFFVPVNQIYSAPLERMIVELIKGRWPAATCTIPSVRSVLKRTTDD